MFVFIFILQQIEWTEEIDYVLESISIQFSITSK